MTPGGGNYMKQLWEDPVYKEKMKKSFSIARQKSWSDEEFAKEKLKTLLDGLNKAWNDPEWRQQRVEELKGSNNPNAKAVINIETNKIFNTIKEAAEWAGLKSVSGIGQCCRGERKTSGTHPETGVRLHWKYLK